MAQFLQGLSQKGAKEATLHSLSCVRYEKGPEGAKVLSKYQCTMKACTKPHKMNRPDIRTVKADDLTPEYEALHK